MKIDPLPIAVGVVLGGLVHLTTVLALPRLALEDAYTRIERLGPANRVTVLPSPTPFEAVLPRLDPAFLHAACRYDLSAGYPLRVVIPLTQDYMSVSFYTRHGLPFYALNDRSAAQRTIDLQLMTPAQRAALPEDEEITAADRLIVESPTLEGVVLVRAFVRERGDLAAISARLAEARCSEMR
jgi:uncharacterized membrane protein